MSYGFSVTHDADGIRLDAIPDGGLKYIPEGKFQISGHAVQPGWSQTETISVSLTDDQGQRITVSGGASIRKQESGE